MNEKVKADGTACNTCAAKTLTKEGAVCEPHKLGQSNRKRNKGEYVLGRHHTSGTTLRPDRCPHPENIVPVGQSTQLLLRKQLNK